MEKQNNKNKEICFQNIPVKSSQNSGRNQNPVSVKPEPDHHFENSVRVKPEPEWGKFFHVYTSEKIHNNNNNIFQ